MNEKAARYIKLVKANVDRAIVAVMFLLVIVLVVILYLEQSGGAATGDESGRPAKLDDKIEQNPYFRTVQVLSSPQQLSQYPEIEQVSKFNMFEYKSVKEKEVLERTANQKYDKAKQAAAAGQTEEALRLLDEIIETLPTHQRARELRDQLRPAGRPATPAATAATTAPAEAAARP